MCSPPPFSTPDIFPFLFFIFFASYIHFYTLSGFYPSHFPSPAISLTCTPIFCSFSSFQPVLPLVTCPAEFVHVLLESRNTARLELVCLQRRANLILRRKADFSLVCKSSFQGFSLGQIDTQIKFLHAYSFFVVRTICSCAEEPPALLCLPCYPSIL